jgi:hypothetical protein
MELKDFILKIAALFEDINEMDSYPPKINSMNRTSLNTKLLKIRL